MDPAGVLKLLADAFLYLGIFGLFSSSMRFAPAVCTGVALGIGALILFEKKKSPFLRALVLLPSLLFLMQVKSLTDAFILLPPLAYILYAAMTGRTAVDREDYLRLFKPLCLFWLAAIPIGLLFDREGAYVLKNALPACIVQLLCSVLLLRLLRHSPAMRRKPRSILLNLVLPLGAVGIAFLLARLGFLSLVGQIAGAIYEKVLAPILLAISYAMFGLIWGVMWILKQAFGEGVELKTRGVSELLPIQDEPNLPASYGGSELFSEVLLAIGLVLAGVIIFFVMRGLLGAVSERREDSGTPDKREGVRDIPPRPRRFFGRGPRDTVRRYFQKAMERAKRQGVTLIPGDTSEAIVQRARGTLDYESFSALRQLYIRARYSPHEITREEAREARRLYHQIQTLENKQAKQKQ